QLLGRDPRRELARSRDLLRERDVQRRVAERVFPAVVARDPGRRGQEGALQLAERLLEAPELPTLAEHVRGLAEPGRRGGPDLEQRLVDALRVGAELAVLIELEVVAGLADRARRAGRDQGRQDRA